MAVAGVWGQVPMAPHPALSEEDAETMVKYVLIIKKIILHEKNFGFCIGSIIYCLSTDNSSDKRRNKD